MEPIHTFGACEHVSITVLVDNRADLIVESKESIKYFTDEPLLAMHGFSALVEFPETGRRVLWDAAGSSMALMENIRLMKIDPASIDVIAISHGHWDHTTGVTDILQAKFKRPSAKEWEHPPSEDEIEALLKDGRVPVIAHPAAFYERWGVKDDGTWVGPGHTPPKDAWLATGADLILTSEPYRLAPGCWTTGYVARESFERTGKEGKAFYRDGDAFHADLLEDDQALVINVRGKGLVILSGCAHAGIVNTVRQAVTMSGVKRVWAILGGFHLAVANQETIQLTMAALQAYEPKLIVPCHCTGFEAMCRFAAEMPEAFVAGQVGATYSF